MSISEVKTKKIEGYAVKQPGGQLEVFHYESPQIGPWEIHVEISHCGICHSDLHLIHNDWGNAQYPFIPGHEIIGTIKEKGPLVNEFEVGDRVGIGWQRSSCGICEYCHQGEENLCLKQEATCVGHHGGFARSIVADSRLAFHIPSSLSSENAAPLLCGGITTFSPFLQHKIDATAKVGVIGIGGLGHFAIQFAHAFGCEVFAFSSTPEKEDEAKKLGAHHFIDSRNLSSIEKAANSVDFLLNTSSQPIHWEAFLQVLRPKGKLCLLGAPKGGEVNVPVFSLLSSRKTLCGSNIGSVPAIRAMLQFAARHQIMAQTEVFPMKEVNTALKKLAENKIHYRAVLKN